MRSATRAHAAVLAVLVLIAVSAPAVAQHVVFEEDFEAGIPPTWTQIQRGWSGDLWTPGFKLVDGTGDVNHEWFCNNGFSFRDNILLSPPIDLSAVDGAWFECGQWQQFPTSRQYNAIEVTTDGGATFAVVYQETGTWSGFGSIKMDISAFAGSASVQVGLHYMGLIANDWSVDNVRITTSPLRHETSALVQGQAASFMVTGAVPGNGIFIVLSGTGAGPLPTRFGNLNLSPPLVFFPGLIADAQGRARANVVIPGGSAGIKLYSQAIELALPATLKLTNSLVLTIQ